MIDDLPNLVSPLLGASIVFATDEWFAAAGIVFIS
jgi:allantoicase